MAYDTKRQCIISSELMPQSHLLRLKPARTNTTAMVLPQNQHPKFIPRRPGKSVYVSLHPEAVELLHGMKGRHVASLRSVLGSDVGKVMVPPRIGGMVGNMLGVRVLQELELIRGRGGVLKELSGVGEVPPEVLGVVDLSTEGEGEVASSLNGEGRVPVWRVHGLVEQAGEVVTLIRDIVAQDGGDSGSDLVAIQLLPETARKRDVGIPLYIALHRAALWKGFGWDRKWVWNRAGRDEVKFPEQEGENEGSMGGSSGEGAQKP